MKLKLNENGKFELMREVNRTKDDIIRDSAESYFLRRMQNKNIESNLNMSGKDWLKIFREFYDFAGISKLTSTNKNIRDNLKNDIIRMSRKGSQCRLTRQERIDIIDPMFKSFEQGVYSYNLAMKGKM